MGGFRTGTGVAPPPAVPMGEAGRPPAAAEPRAESFVEDLYTCQPNDTYRSISVQLYGTPKYERALQRYNQDFLPPGGDAWRRRAAGGGGVPPIRILERRYAALLGDGVVAVGGTAAPPPEGEPLARLASPVTRPGYATPPAASPPAPAPKYYTVREP